MENKSSDQRISGESSVPMRASALDTSENLNRKYPFLTAYVGFIILYIVAWVQASLIAGVLQLIYSLIRYGKIQSLVNLPLTFLLQIVIGFQAFKYVVNKNIIPYSNNKRR